MSKIKNWLLTLPLLATSMLHAADEAAPKGGSMWQTVIMIGLALVFFYFIMWRPERKRRKAAEERRNALKKGDKVTAMGILGTIVKVQDETVVLRLYDGAKMELLKAAITDVKAGSEEDLKKIEKEEARETKASSKETKIEKLAEST
jgi:preprotein translocase subunit YajC